MVSNLVLTISSVAVVALLSAYHYFTRYFDFFKRQGIPTIRPVPIFGSWWGAWRLRDFHLVEKTRCKKYGRLYGMLNGRTPAVVVSDPVLIKQILVKDFDHFADRNFFPTRNEYLTRAAGFLKGSEWKTMRSILSPALTTGRIKKMVGLMNEPAVALVKHLSGVPPGEKVNIRDKMTAFVLDVTATVAFGIKVNALDDPDNPFVVKGRQSFTPTPEIQSTVPFVLAALYPGLAQYAEPAVMTAGIQFFAQVATDVVRSRKELPAGTPKRNDLVDVMLEAAETHKIFQEDEKLLIAQLVTFLIGGLDTTAFTLAMTLHCLAMHPMVQDRLREDVLKAISSHGDEINYDVIRELPYMDQCIMEAMRLYPAAARLERVCTQDISYPNAFTLKKGMSAIIPVYALHMNPEYYSDPQTYNPDRFSADSKRARAGDESLFLGFGSGNRACLGMRFAKDNMKLGLAHLLHNFRFVPVQETRDPPHVEVRMLGLLHNDECWVGIEKFGK